MFKFQIPHNPTIFLYVPDDKIKEHLKYLGLTDVRHITIKREGMAFAVKAKEKIMTSEEANANGEKVLVLFGDSQSDDGVLISAEISTNNKVNGN